MRRQFSVPQDYTCHRTPRPRGLASPLGRPRPALRPREFVPRLDGAGTRDARGSGVVNFDTVLDEVGLSTKDVSVVLWHHQYIGVVEMVASQEPKPYMKVVSPSVSPAARSWPRAVPVCSDSVSASRQWLFSMENERTGLLILLSCAAK